MSLKSIRFLLTLLLLSAASSQSIYAKKIRSKPTPTFSAFNESENETATSFDDAGNQISSPRALLREKSAKHARNSKKFDWVPEDKVESLIKRIEMTNLILQKFHRAYDYRTLTLKELEIIRGELELQLLASKTPPNQEAERN